MPGNVVAAVVAVDGDDVAGDDDGQPQSDW